MVPPAPTERQGRDGGHHTNAGRPAWLCTGLALLRNDASPPQHKGAWRHPNVTRRSTTLSKETLHSCSLQEQGREQVKTLLHASQEARGVKEVRLPQVSALTFVPGGPGHRR